MNEIIFEDKKIAYRAGGYGQPVILLHGFAEDSRLWDYQYDELVKKFYVIIPDLPGSGASELLSGKPGVEDYADVIKAIADEELVNRKQDAIKSNRFTLIGHSMGGYITLAFAEKYPELLQAIGLFHSSAFADDEPKKEARRKGIDFIKRNSAFDFLKASLPNLFSEQTKNEHPEMIEKLISNATGFSPETLIQYYEAMIKRPDRTQVLKTYEGPVLFISGKYDTAVPPALSLAQSHLPLISHFHMLQHSGHMGMWEERDRSTSILLDFLDMTGAYLA